jgi:hypothetical protein
MMIPHTPNERLILLEEIERGDKVVIPTSLEHAKFMLMVAQSYINDHKDRVIGYLKNDNATTSRN